MMKVEHMPVGEFYDEGSGLSPESEFDPMPVAINPETEWEDEDAESLQEENPLILLHFNDVGDSSEDSTIVPFFQERKRATSQKARENKAWRDELPTFEESERWNEERGAYMGPLLHDYNPERDYPTILPPMKAVLSLGKNGSIDRTAFVSLGIRDCDLFAEGNIHKEGEVIHVGRGEESRMFLERSVNHYRSIVESLAQKHRLDNFVLASKSSTREKLRRVCDVLLEKGRAPNDKEGEVFDIFEYKRLKRNGDHYFWVPKEHVENENPRLWNDEWEISPRDGKTVWERLYKKPSQELKEWDNFGLFEDQSIQLAAMNGRIVENFPLDKSLFFVPTEDYVLDNTGDYGGKWESYMEKVEKLSFKQIAKLRIAKRKKKLELINILKKSGKSGESSPGGKEKDLIDWKYK